MGYIELLKINSDLVSSNSEIIEFNSEIVFPMSDLVLVSLGRTLRPSLFTNKQTLFFVLKLLRNCLYKELYVILPIYLCKGTKQKLKHLYNVLVKTAVNVAFLTFYKLDYNASIKNAYLSLQKDKKFSCIRCFM